MARNTPLRFRHLGTLQAMPNQADPVRAGQRLTARQSSTIAKKMKKVMKALIAVGIILIVTGLAGRAFSTASVVQEKNTQSVELSETISDYRKKSETYKWIAFAGGVIVIGARVSLWFQSRRYPVGSGQPM